MKKSRLLGPVVVAGAVLTGAMLVPSIVNAQEDAPPVEVPTEVSPDQVSPDFDADLDLGIEDEFTPEDLAAFNAETDELATKIQAAGIPVTVTEEDGFRYLEFPDELTEDQEAALDDIFGELFDVEGDFDGFELDGDFELTEEDIAQFNAETQELVDALAAAGINVDVTTDAEGFVDFEIPENLTEEQLAAVNGVFEELFDCPEDEGDHTESSNLDGTTEDNTGADQADV